MNQTRTTDAPTTIPGTVGTTIDMLDPAQTCAALRIDERRLVTLVNEAKLAVYDFGEGLRFRYRDVSALVGQNALAAA